MSHSLSLSLFLSLLTSRWSSHRSPASLSLLFVSKTTSELMTGKETLSPLARRGTSPKYELAVNNETTEQPSTGQLKIPRDKRNHPHSLPLSPLERHTVSQQNCKACQPLCPIITRTHRTRTKDTFFLSLHQRSNPCVPVTLFVCHHILHPLLSIASFLFCIAFSLCPLLPSLHPCPCHQRRLRHICLLHLKPIYLGLDE